MTTSTVILRSLHPAEVVSRDTSGSPPEGGEAVSANTRGTTTKPTRHHPPYRTKTNEINLRSYLPPYIYLALELALDPYRVFYRTVAPYASPNGLPSFPLLHALVHFAIVCSRRISIFSSCIVFFPLRPFAIMSFTFVLSCNALPWSW